MKVAVQLINEKGRGIPSKDRPRMPTYRGVLRMRQVRSPSFGRVVVTAELLPQTDSSGLPLLPALLDAGILFLAEGQMRIRGFELVEGAQYGQTWDVRVQ